MALINGTDGDIVAAINREVAAPLDATGLYFSPAFAVAGADPTLTKLRLTALETYQYRGTVVLQYHRLRLDDLPAKFLVPPKLAPVSTLYELLPVLRSKTGIVLDTTDVDDAPVTTAGDGTKSVVLTAKATSRGWIGSCTLTFTGLPPLSTALKTTDIGWN